MIYPIPPRNTFGKCFTAYSEGFLSQEDISLLLAQPEWQNMQEGLVDGYGDGVNPQLRITDIAWMGLKPEVEHIWKQLADVVAEINSRYFHFDLTGIDESMQLGLYTGEKQGHYTWHIDAMPTDRRTPRKLSVAILLSDPSEFEGGEFQVKTHNDEAQTLECKKGRAWFFSSHTLHRVAPVTKGVRRSLVFWAHGPEFR
jgi:PKHD-type hydroxylase